MSTRKTQTVQTKSREKRHSGTSQDGKHELLMGLEKGAALSSDRGNVSGHHEDTLLLIQQTRKSANMRVRPRC